MKRSRGAFRVAAASAKERLASGFWEAEGLRIQTVACEAEKKGISTKQAIEFYLAKLGKQISDEVSEDEQLYQKVVAILRTDSGANPLSMVLDREHMRTLSERERERYVLDLGRAVQDCVARFHKERVFEMDD